MSKGIIWFSHRENIYKVNKGKFSCTENEKIWDWDNCTVSFAYKKDEKLRFVIRSNARINSTYLGKNLFTWQNIPKVYVDNEKLIDFLKDEHEIDWADKAKIFKSSADKIEIYSGEEKKVEIILDENNQNAKLKFKEGALYDLQVKVEDDQINIYRGKPAELRYMLGFEVNYENIKEPQTECYIVRNSGKKEGPKLRWVLNLDDKHCIWEWAKNASGIKESYIYELYQSINKTRSLPLNKNDNIFNLNVEEKSNKIIPVIYQPAVDALENYIREVHCNETENNDGSKEIEVTLVFHDEQLRNNFFLNRLYQWLREKILYGRKNDIESFKILISKESSDFVFENIYSKIGEKEYGLKFDNIHGDKTDPPNRKIKYFFNNSRHPIVFINTSNHAMAESDTNHRLWKFEYIPWLENSAVILGVKSRKDVEKQIEKKNKIKSETKSKVKK